MIAPRRLVHRGWVLAVGWLDPREREGLVLAHWRPGAVVRRTAAGLVLLLPTRTRIAAWSVPGYPLVEQGGAYLTAPLAVDEIEALSLASGDLVAVLGGHAIRLGVGEPVDPAEWIDLEGFARAEVGSLGDPPRPAAPCAPPAKAREDLFAEAVGSRSPEVDEILGGLRSPRTGGGFGAGLLRALGRMVGAVAERMPSGATAGPSWLQRLDRWLAAAAVRAGFASLLGARHAQLLQQMMDRFASDDLQDALRHAIPLGGARESLGLAGFLAGGGRDLVVRRPGPARSILVGDELMERLRILYEQAERKLEAAGRYEEAAYVLAELLDRVDEAILLLERHHLFRRAAEVAEARDQPPGLAVRLWFLAGEVGRAMVLARRHEAFSDAVARLERTDAARARPFRVAWAATLAKAGRYGAAAEVLLERGMDPPVVLEWLERAIAAGGTAGCRALAVHAARHPDAFDDVVRAAVAILEDPTPGAERLREALAQALLGQGDARAVRVLARPTVRALAADLARRGATPDRERRIRLLARRAGGELAADLPGFDGVAPPGELPALRVDVPPGDSGSTPVHDAVRLPSGDLLVALGQGGIALHRSDGRRVVWWDHPAGSLAVSDDGTRAIGLDHRGTHHRLTRIDLASRRAAYWCDARFTLWARTFAWMWFVVDDGLYGIDPLAEGWASLWHTAPRQGRIDRLARDVRHLSLGVMDGPDGEVWTYRLPDLRLRARKPLAPARSGGRLGPVLPEGGIDEWEPAVDGRWVVTRRSEPEVSHGDRYYYFPAGEPAAYLASPGWAGVVHSGGVQLRRAGRRSREVSLRIPGSTGLRAHIDGGVLTVVDRLGRVIVVDLEAGAAVADLRL